MFRTTSFLLVVVFLTSAGPALAQWTCDTAMRIDLPYENAFLETHGPDAWGIWQRFELERPAVVEISGGADGPPGYGRADLWSACLDGAPLDRIDWWDSPDFESAAPFVSGRLSLAAGEYWLETRIVWPLGPSFAYSGWLRILVRYPLEIRVLRAVNPRSRGVIPVAILGSAQFDVSDLDPSTLRFGPGRAAPVHDLGDPWTYNEHVTDVNLDGFVDLVAHFSLPDAGIACADESASLEGLLDDGQAVEGQGSLHTVGCWASRGTTPDLASPTRDLTSPRPDGATRPAPKS